MIHIEIFKMLQIVEMLENFEIDTCHSNKRIIKINN